MKKYAKFITITIALVFTSFHVKAEQGRFVQKLKISPDTTAVIAEGDLEARSIGSFSIRLYSTNKSVQGDDTTFLKGGIIYKRDGAIKNLVQADIDRDGVDEIIVIVSCVGSGSYLAAHAFTFAGGSPVLLASVSGLAPESDPIAALKKSKMKK